MSSYPQWWQGKDDWLTEILILGIFISVICLKATPEGIRRQSTPMGISRESVYNVYTVDNQQPKCLQKSLHFLQSVYILDGQ